MTGVPSSPAVLVAPSSPSSSSSWRWRCWPCTVGGAPFSIGSQCAFLGEDGCSLDTILGGTVPTRLASDTNLGGTVPTRADSSGFPAGVSSELQF